MQGIPIAYHSQFNWNKLLVLCQKHSKVSYQVGLHNSCQQHAALCRHQCNDQIKHHKNDKHQYQPMQRLIARLQNMVQKANAFKHLSLEKQLPMFVQRLKSIAMSIEGQLMKQLLSNEHLINNFCVVNTNGSQIIRDLLEEPPQDWNIAQYTCRDITALNSALDFIEKENQEGWSQRIKRYIKFNAERILEKADLIPNTKPTDTKQTCSIFIKSYTLDKANQQLEMRLKDINLKMDTDNKTINKIIIELHQNLVDPNQKKQFFFLAKHNQVEMFYKKLGEYIKKIKVPTLILSVKIPVDKHIFWEKLNNLFTKTTHLKSIEVFSSKSIQNDFYIRQARLYHNHLTITVHGNVSWDDDPAQIDQVANT